MDIENNELLKVGKSLDASFLDSNKKVINAIDNNSFRKKLGEFIKL